MSESNSQHFPSIDRFEKFLNNYPYPVLAHNWTCFNCPLALWLRHEGFEYPYVSERSWSPSYKIPENRRMFTRLPEWAKDFVYFVDRHKFSSSYITITQCKQLLKEVRQLHKRVCQDDIRQS